MKNNTIQKYLKKCKFEDNLCYAILINLKNPLKYNYTIPNIQDLQQYIKFAIKQCKNQILPKIYKTLKEIILEYYNSNSKLHKCLWEHNWIFEYNFFYEKGIYFKFKNPQKIKKEIKQYFNKKELMSIKKISTIINKKIKENLIL